MAKILHVEASPRKERSHSLKVASSFIEALKTRDASAEIDTIDVWSADIPEFNGAMLEAKYAVMGGENPKPEHGEAWAAVQKLFDEFNQADKYIFSVPMWNFGIPYRLKQYIDVITQPGMAWSYTPEEGYKGLLQNKKAMVVYSSGDGYGEGTGFEAYDLQKPAFSLWLQFIGVSDIQSLAVESTLFPDKSNEEQMIAKAKELAAGF